MLDEQPCLLQGSLGKTSLPKNSVKGAQDQNLSRGQVGVGPGTTWSMIEGRGYIAAAHRGRCDSFLLLEELPWVVRPLGNNGCCLLGARGKDQSRAGQPEAVPVGLTCPVPQFSPLPPIPTSSSGSLPLHLSGHPGEKRNSVLGTPTRNSPSFLHNLAGRGWQVAALLPLPSHSSFSPSTRPSATSSPAWTGAWAPSSAPPASSPQIPSFPGALPALQPTFFQTFYPSS